MFMMLMRSGSRIACSSHIILHLRSTIVRQIARRREALVILARRRIVEVREPARVAREHLDVPLGALGRAERMAVGDRQVLGAGVERREKVGLDVEECLSGPLGGDVQIAARIVSGEVDVVFFLVDPLDKHPHDPDIQAVQRVCNVHDVPLATNVATANLIISAETV